MNFADRLVEAIRHMGTPLCVGLDPVLERIPADITAAAVKRKGPGREGAAAAIEAFCRRILGALCGRVPAVKIQSACFELYGPPGALAFEAVVKDARALGYVVIGDLKRGDVGVSAQHYADAWLGGAKLPDGTTDPGPGLDAITVNAYPGPDSVEPFLAACRRQDGGVFVLVATSNPGAASFQNIGNEGHYLYNAVAREVAHWGLAMRGESGYASVGAVVGATKPLVARELRKQMPHAFFLVPGIGAQGATAADLVPFFNADGLGSLVPVSRTLIYAHEARPGVAFEDAVRDEAENLRQAFKAAIEGAK